MAQAAAALLCAVCLATSAVLAAVAKYTTGNRWAVTAALAAFAILFGAVGVGMLRGAVSTDKAQERKQIADGIRLLRNNDL